MYQDKIDILLVDDRRENLISLAAVLANPRYNLIQASSGDEALRYLLKNTPALILMDVQMPDINGFETATLIKNSERTREIPIIFITAMNKDESFVHKGYDHGAVDYIYKPYDAHILKSKVAVFSEIRNQHSRISRLVSVQQAATQALAETSKVNDAIAGVLKSICTSLGWDLGVFWKVSEKANVLYCHTEWHVDNSEGLQLTHNVNRLFSPGVGLPGRVWAERAAHWIEGPRTSMASPVVVGNATLGVIEFHSQMKLQQDPELVKIMEAIGWQIGQVIKLEDIAIENEKLFNRAQEAIQSRDEFFSIASHELKTPLTTLKMLIQVLQLGVKPAQGVLPPPEKISKMLSTSLKQVDRLNYLVEDLLDVVKIRSGQMSYSLERVNLSELALEVVGQHTEALASAKSRVELDIEPNIVGNWDGGRIQQIFVNLISNAIKYAPGKLVRVSLHQDNGIATLRVQDFGPGIPPEQQPKIFERFERATAMKKVGGLGLGLFIVKKIVAAHHGKIRIESEPGKGSTFIVELPLQWQMSEAGEPGAGGKTVPNLRCADNSVP